MSTNIEWTNETWNPIRGCSRVSEGCRNCYAERQAIRQSNPGGKYEGLVRIAEVGKKREPRWTGKIVFDEKKLQEPLRWRWARRVFVNSMSDLFHEGVTEAQLDQIFSVMWVCPHITFQVLTKRPERMKKYLNDPATRGRIRAATQRWWQGEWKEKPHRYNNALWPLQNVWLGVSVEDQKTADERIPVLLQTPAIIRWVSYEPALGSINFERVPLPDAYLTMNGITGVLQPRSEKDTEPDDYKYWTRHGYKLDWVVIGGESGPGARPLSLRWVRSAISECQSAEVPIFVKQLGARPGTPSCASFDCTHPDCGVEWLKLKDRKGGEMAEWPEDLRIRQYPHSQKKVMEAIRAEIG